MNKLGPILVIEDDLDDQEIFTLIFSELQFPNEVMFFLDAESLLSYLKDEHTQPFLILSDINLPKVNGYEIRSIIAANAAMNEKCVPFILFSTHVDSILLKECYMTSIQGCFQKPFRYDDLKDIVRAIVHYWQKSYSPFSRLEFAA